MKKSKPIKIEIEANLGDRIMFQPGVVGPVLYIKGGYEKYTLKLVADLIAGGKA